MTDVRYRNIALSKDMRVTGGFSAVYGSSGPLFGAFTCNLGVKTVIRSFTVVVLLRKIVMSSQVKPKHSEAYAIARTEDKRRYEFRVAHQRLDPSE